MNIATAAGLDPGIVSTVRLLCEHGFETTDSGDGVSKPADWYRPDEHGITQAMPFPHVVCRVPFRRDVFREAARLQKLLGDAWTVEASFTTKEPHAILLASTAAVDPPPPAPSTPEA